MQPLQCVRAAFVALSLVAVSGGPALAQGGAVRGSVADTDGHPIKGATIKANNPSGRPSTLTATSDDKGRFAMIGLVGGRWTFIAEAPGFVPQQGSTQVRSTTTGNSPIEFVLSRAALPPPGTLTKQIQADIASADEIRNSGRFDQAIAAYQEIAEKNPTLTMVNMVIGDAYRQKASKEENATARQPLYDRALVSYQQVLKNDPDNERARIEVAMTLMQKGSLDEAERILAISPGTPASAPVLFGLGEIKFAKGDTAGAEQLFQRALAMDPAWLQPKLRLGLIAYAQGNRDVATQLFKTVIAADATSPEAIQAGTYLKELAK